jgi:hypothetical protein
VRRRIKVTAGGVPVANLNELEFVNGEIFANIWFSDRIARIAPLTGEVTGWIDLSGLLTAADRRDAEVLNGIAYDVGGIDSSSPGNTGRSSSRFGSARPNPETTSTPTARSDT